MLSVQKFCSLFFLIKFIVQTYNWTQINERRVLVHNLCASMSKKKRKNHGDGRRTERKRKFKRAIAWICAQQCGIEMTRSLASLLFSLRLSVSHSCFTLLLACTRSYSDVTHFRPKLEIFLSFVAHHQNRSLWRKAFCSNVCDATANTIIFFFFLFSFILLFTKS